MSARQRIPIIERFWAKVDRIDRGCWPWSGARDKDGYGAFKISPGDGTYRQEKAHRVAWVLTFGPLRDSDLVLHHCDNESCVRPSHLFVGTHLVNQRDRRWKERSITRGQDHPWSKLGLDDIEEIRRLYEEGGLTQNQIAEQFNIDQTHVSRIVRHKSWRHT